MAGAKPNYEDWTQEELIAEINKLSEKKEYGLVWDEERELEDVVLKCKKELPVLKEVKSKAIPKRNPDPEKPTHILIEGDNYHALSVLNYTHEKAIDVIYIDPPYNTGAKDWKYNNNYVDQKDSYRHSKWISMMHNRLAIAKYLLKDDGIIIVAIDDHEIHNIRHIADKIFGWKNHIATICAEVNPAGQNIKQNSPAVSHDYSVIYSKNEEFRSIILRSLTLEEEEAYPLKDEKGWFLWDNLRRRGGNSRPTDRPGQWFPLFVDEKSKSISLKKFEGSTEVWPIDPQGIKRIWRVNPDGFQREYDAGQISIIEKRTGYRIVKKSYKPKGKKPKTLWKTPKHSGTTYGTKLLKEIIGENDFNYPKSLFLVIDCLKYWTNKDSIVLDFFAGSGTTAHAVLEMNKKDNGNRQCIIVTNNENNIASEITYPRVKNVICGYNFVGNKKELLFEEKINLTKLRNADKIFTDYLEAREKNVDTYDELKGEFNENTLKLFGIKNYNGFKDGLGGNLKYFKTGFVPALPSDKNKEFLTRKSVEMLCLRESTFEPVSENEIIKVFKNNSKHTAILFDETKIDDLKEMIFDLETEVFVYVFSLEDDDFSEEFEDMNGNVKVCSIPAAILNVYRRIFK